MPLVFPVAELFENIFKISSKENIRRVFIENPKTNINIILGVLFVKASIRKEIASNKIIKSKNLYPPIFLNIFGASSRAKIEQIEPKMYTMPTSFSPTKEDIKLELI